MDKEEKRKSLKEDPPAPGEETKTDGVQDGAGEWEQKTEEVQEPEGGAQETSGSAEERAAALEELLKDPEIKAAFDAKVQEAVEAAMQQPEGEGEPGTEPAEELSPEERAAREMETKEKGLADREKALAVREMKAAAIEELAKEQLPAALADCFNYESEEAFKQSKDSVVKAFQEALKDAVNARLRRNGAPKAAEPGSVSKGKARGNTFADIVKSQRARR